MPHEQDPLGRTFGTASREWQVVGVAADVRHSSLEESAGHEMYLPLSQMPSRSLDRVARSSMPVAASLRAALREVDVALPLTDVRPLESVVERVTSPRRFFMKLLGAFAAIALALASLGIYGVISYGVN